MADYKRNDRVSGDTARIPQQGAAPRQVTRKKRKKKKRMNPLLYLLFVLITSALLAGIGWLLISDLCAFNKGTKEETVVVEITGEDTVKTVAEKLEEADLIEYKWFFRLFAKFANAEEKIGMGTYTLHREMDYRALIVGMRSSVGNMSGETVTVTIPEGYTVEQTIKLLAKHNVNTEEALMEAAATADFKYDFIDDETEDISRLEGYLFPDTYEFYVGHNAKDALLKLIKNFDNKIDQTMLDKIAQSKYSLKQVIVIASLIEKETDGTDHAKIASVIYNRLKDDGSHGTYGMLNIDAALLYDLPEGTTSISSADKELDSPYNLYKYAGLPPTAIANPGLASIRAAIEPETTDYYYYALGKDGRHHYSKTLTEHNNFLNSGAYGG